MSDGLKVSESRGSANDTNDNERHTSKYNNNTSYPNESKKQQQQQLRLHFLNTKFTIIASIHWKLSSMVITNNVA